MATTAELITQLYVGYYNRAPDPEGLNYWIGRANAGVSMADIANSFAASPEAIATYPYLAFPNVANAETFLEQVYQNLFNRSIDADGREYYANKLATGQTTPGQIIAEIQANANTNPNNTDGQVLANKVTVGLDFALEAASTPGFEYEGAAVNQANTVLDNVTDSQASVDAALASNDTFFDNVVENTFTLTTNVDAPGAAAPAEDTAGGTGNDVYNAILVNNGAAAAAAGSTLQVSDLINGGAGTDTLNVTVTGANSTTALVQSAPVTTGVEVVSVRNVSTGTANGVTLDLSLVEGEQRVVNSGSTGAVAFTGVNSNVAVAVANTIAATTVTFANDSFGADATATVAVNGAGTGGATGTSAAVTLGTVSAAADVDNLVIDATGSNFVTLASGATALSTGVETLRVTGSGSLNLAAASTVDGSTLAATLTSLDASANTGGVTATVSNVAVDVLGGAGSDTITVTGALNASASINLGAGNDELVVGTGGSIGNTTPVDGGAGRDTIGANAVNAGNGSQFLNFELLGLNLSTGALDLAVLTGSSIEGLELLAGGGTYTNVDLTDALLVETNVTGTTDINFRGATGDADSYSITFNGNGGTTAPTAVNFGAGTVDLDGVENINIASGGTNAWNSVTLAGDTAQSVTVTGASNLTLAFDTAFGGTAGAGNEVTSINASAATGRISVDVANVVADAAGLTVVTGSGNDTLATSSFAVTLTGGAGNDLFDVTDAVYGTVPTAPATGVFTTITDFSAGDVIDFNNVAANGGADASMGAALNVGAATTLAQALNIAANDSTDDFVWFQYAGNTYVVADASDDAGADAGIDAADQVVQLTGLVDLSNDQYNATGGSLAFA